MENELEETSEPETEEGESEEESTDEEEENSEEAEEESEDEEEEEESDEVAKLREENEKLRKDNKTLTIQKKKAQKKAIPADPKLSSKDVLAIVKSEVHDDDVDEVIDFAKFKKITVAEALKSPTLQAILSDNTERRKTAEVANTKKSRRGARKTSATQLQKDLGEGKVPEPGSEEAEELFWARRGGKPQS